MLDDTSPSWWYEQDGQQAGPVTAAAVGRLVAEGRLGPAHRVWRDGMAGWVPLASVPELAPALQGARPPPGPPPLSGPDYGAGRPHVPPPVGARWAPPAGVVAAPALEEVSVPGVVLLSIVTLGIYGLVKFHQTGKAYEALAGRASRFSRDFWLFVGLGIASFLVNAGTAVLGVPLAIASVVFQILTLNEALALRAEGARRAGIRPRLTPDGTHRALFVAGVVLSWVVVGLVLLLVQAAKWFSDWNAIVAAIRAGPAAAADPAGTAQPR